MRAQETEDAELVALAALVFREAATVIAMAAPILPAVDPAESTVRMALEAALKLRGVLPRAG